MLRVERVGHGEHAARPYVPRKHVVERAQEPAIVGSRRDPYVCDLSARVRAAVGAAGPANAHGSSPVQAAQGVLDDALHRLDTGLDLPAGVRGPVVGEVDADPPLHRLSPFETEAGRDADRTR